MSTRVRPQPNLTPFVFLLDLADAIYISHVLLHLSMSPSVSHRDLSPSLLVPRSKPHVRPSLLPVHQHGTSVLDLHLAVDHRLRAPHLRTKPRDMLHNPTHAMISSPTQPKTQVTLTITHHNRTTRAHINLAFAYLQASRHRNKLLRLQL